MSFYFLLRRLSFLSISLSLSLSPFPPPYLFIISIPSPPLVTISVICTYLLSLACLHLQMFSGNGPELLSAISTIESMGYNEVQARAALTATDNNLER